MDRPYATPVGVRTYLSSLKGMHALREDRRLAAARFEILPAFCVLGSHVLTADGRFGELVGVSAGLRELPDVVALDELDRRGRRAHGNLWRLSYRMPAALAPCEGLCPECGRGWTFHARADVVETRGPYVLIEEREDGFITTRSVEVISRHVRCHEAAVLREALADAMEALEDAGFADATPEPCPTPSGGFGPWFRLATPAGAIRFGRRGRGYGLDWSDTGKDLMGRFCRIENLSPFGPIWNEPPVPHGPFHVDPKDDAYLVRYLHRLRLALGL